MNLQQLINARESLNQLQLESLIHILSSRCRREVKERIKSIVMYSFYSTFDTRWFSTRFIIRDTYVEYNPGQSYPDEIKQIRKELLGL